MRNEECLIHEILGCVYAQLVLEVGMRELDNPIHSEPTRRYEQITA